MSEVIKLNNSLVETFPSSFNFEVVNGAIAFQKTPGYAGLLADIESKRKTNNIVKWVARGGAALIFVIFMLAGSFFTGLFYGLIAFAVISIGTWITGKMVTAAELHYFNEKWDHGELISNKLQSLLRVKAYHFAEGTILFYSNDLCVYVDVETGNGVGLLKENIKEALLEHVHLGSTTTGTSTSKTKGTVSESLFSTNSYRNFNTSSKTTTTSVAHTKDHYEWRLDIFSNFIDMPKLSFVFPDDADGEANVKTIYALLKP